MVSSNNSSLYWIKVATQWAWSRGRGSSDVILTSNTGPLFLETWWANQVILSSTSDASIRRIFSSHFCSTVKSISHYLYLSPMVYWLWMEKGGWMLVKESGSSGTLFTLLSLIRIDSCFSPSLSVDRCWKSEMIVPWKEVVAVVAVGLWSMLSIAAGGK